MATGKACQLFDKLKQKYNTNNKLTRAQIIKKLNEIKPKKGEDSKMMCDKVEALGVKYWDQAKILGNDTIVIHLFLVCVKLYKSAFMQAQVEADVNNMEIMYKSQIRNINVAWRIKSGGEDVAQVEKSKVVLMNTEFKGKCHTCEKYGHKQNKCPKKNKSEEEKGNKKFTGKCNHCGKVGHKAVNCWEHETNKTRDPRIRRRKKKRK